MKHRALALRLLSWLMTAALVLGLLAVISLFLLPRMFGWHLQVVLSGSMEPTLPVGSVTFVEPKGAEDVHVGDLLAYRSPDDRSVVVTHRVVATEGEGPALGFQTKGDANDGADPYVVPAINVMGTVRWHLPWLGYLARYLRTPVGFLTLVGIPGAFVIIGEVFNIFGVLRRARRREHEPEQVKDNPGPPHSLAAWLTLGGIAALAVSPALLRRAPSGQGHRQKRNATRPRKDSRLRPPLCLVFLTLGLVGSGVGLWGSGSYALFSDSETSSGNTLQAAALEAPSGLDCHCLCCFRAELEWTASPSSGVEGYRIYHSGPWRHAFSLLDEVPAPSTTYDELRPSFLRHRYFVTAFLQSWDSGPSDTIEVHCRPRLFSFPGPCDLRAEDHHSQRAIELTWEEVANATDYVVLRATTSGGPYDVAGTTPATAYTDAAVSEGVTYYYLVVALDAEGNESDPSEEVAVPDTASMPTPTAPSPTPTPAEGLPDEGGPEPEEAACQDCPDGAVGDAESAAPQEAPSPPPIPTIEYQVQPGDTLTAIAARFGTTVEALVRLNGLQQPNLILYGSTLNVPYVGEDAGGAPAGVSPVQVDFSLP